jgi:hypothetical protein
LHLVETLVFAAALFAMADRRVRPVRPWIGVPAAIALLYYDSRLPGLARAFSQASLVASFSGVYLWELAGRFVSWKVIALVVVRSAVRRSGASCAGRRGRAGWCFVLAMPKPRRWTSRRETGRARRRPRGTGSGCDARGLLSCQGSTGDFAKPGAPFDVIFIHVCSLSWDDLEATGLAQHPLLSD